MPVDRRLAHRANTGLTATSMCVRCCGTAGRLMSALQMPSNASTHSPLCMHTGQLGSLLKCRYARPTSRCLHRSSMSVYMCAVAMLRVCSGRERCTWATRVS